MSSETLPQVFIIESLEREDESRRREGKILYNILRMMERKPRYTYIRTVRELERLAIEFAESRYRYLHLSCHGNTQGFAMTYDEIPFERFEAIFGGFLHERRLFLSACNVAQPKLARRLFKEYETAPYSATGPRESVDFSTVAVVWASLYDLLFRDGSPTVQGDDICKHLNELCKLHEIKFGYFGRTTTQPYFREQKLPTLSKRRRRVASSATDS